MSGNRVTRTGSAHPPRQIETDPLRQDPAGHDTLQNASSPSPAPGAAETLSALKRADLRWGREQTDPSGTTTGQQSSVPDSGPREQWLAELEDLSQKLKEQVARHGLLAEVQSATIPASDAALLQRCEILGEIAALALGIELRSREGQIRRDLASEQDRMLKISPPWKEGSAK